MSSHGGRRRRHEEQEEHENHERWLVTYADMVTLLMVLFIVMFAMSQVDERKYAELKEGLAAGFPSSTSPTSTPRSSRPSPTRSSRPRPSKPSGPGRRPSRRPAAWSGSASG